MNRDTILQHMLDQGESLLARILQNGPAILESGVYILWSMDQEAPEESPVPIARLSTPTPGQDIDPTVSSALVFDAIREETVRKGLPGFYYIQARRAVGHKHVVFLSCCLIGKDTELHTRTKKYIYDGDGEYLWPVHATKEDILDAQYQLSGSGGLEHQRDQDGRIRLC